MKYLYQITVNILSCLVCAAYHSLIRVLLLFILADRLVKSQDDIFLLLTRLSEVALLNRGKSELRSMKF